MELIRRDTDYALRLLIELASHEHDEAVPVRQLSSRTDVSRDFVHKIMQKLAHAGIVRGRPGKGGGYTLERDPSGLDLLEVVSIVQGPPAVNRCLIDKKHCRRSGTCPIRSRLESLQQALVDSLGQTTLQEIVEQD